MKIDARAAARVGLPEPVAHGPQAVNSRPSAAASPGLAATMRQPPGSSSPAEARIACSIRIMHTSTHCSENHLRSVVHGGSGGQL